uniref:Proteasome subunit beta type-1 n=2 Tax=Zea mays TaxID=4577 RepID=A0A804QT41_MAIZE
MAGPRGSRSQKATPAGRGTHRLRQKNNPKGAALPPVRARDEARAHASLGFTRTDPAHASGDIKALHKNLAARELLYQHQHNKRMSCPAMAQLLSNTLYYKRFFPYYAFNVLGGLDSEGKGCVFTYDAVGSYERTGYSAQGTGSILIMSVLNNQLKSPRPLLLPARDEGSTLILESIKYLERGFLKLMHKLL